MGFRQTALIASVLFAEVVGLVTITTLAYVPIIQAPSSEPEPSLYVPTPSRVPDLGALDSVVVPSPTPTGKAVRLPTPAVTPSPSPGETKSPRVSPKPTKKPQRVKFVEGIASTYGDGYEGLFAMPMNLGGRGEHVQVCGTLTGRCITRISNDVGPVVRLHRVADLDATDFEYLCKCKWEVRGTMRVRITWVN